MANKINMICRELFYVLTVALAVLAILEILWPGVVLAYLNMNYVLIFWLITGMIALINSRNI